MIVCKLKLVVKFIQANKKLGLDPDRRLDKDPTVKLLAEGPIAMKLYF